MNNDTIAIIPARSGSKSVKDKNITLLSDFPLIAYSIVVGYLVKSISRVIVSTDSEDYAKIARKFGAEVPFIRPTEISSDESIDNDFFLHAMNWLSEHEGSVPEYWVHLRPTTPLRNPEIIDNAINTIKSSNVATSLRSGHQCPESPLKWFSLDQDGYFKGFMNSDNNVDYSNQPRQNFPPVYIPNGYVDVVRASHVMKLDTLHGNNMIGFESPAISEIDSIEELQYIQYQLDRDGSLLLDDLKSRF